MREYLKNLIKEVIDDDSLERISNALDQVTIAKRKYSNLDGISRWVNSIDTVPKKGKVEHYYQLVKKLVKRMEEESKKLQYEEKINPFEASKRIVNSGLGDFLGQYVGYLQTAIYDQKKKG